jgi:coenzyme PQQ precursor peptide PqqA
MNTEQAEVWIAPDFEEISAAMECTAYFGQFHRRRVPQIRAAVHRLRTAGVNAWCVMFLSRVFRPGIFSKFQILDNF